MDRIRLSHLKEKLVNADKFGDVVHFFFDHFGENPEFMALGNLAHNPFLESVIVQVVRQLAGPDKPRSVSNLRLAHLPDEKFYHGGFQVDNRLCTLIYFDDIGLGLIAIHWEGPDEMKYARFRGQVVGTAPRRPKAGG